MPVRPDIILDLTGGPALVPADLRDGYLRADPGSPTAILQAVLKARDLVGTFEKPRYITFDAGLCAHSRSKQDRLHPLSRFLSRRRDHTCRQPCGDRRQHLRGLRPMRDGLSHRRRVLCAAGGRRAGQKAACHAARYRQAGGERAVVLVHDESHGAPLIDALSRFGDGLPANVLPFAVNEVTQIGLESIVAAFAYGVSAVRFLLRAKPRHDVSGLTRTVALADPILAGSASARPGFPYRDRRSGPF